jgi:hypothetical protein
MQISLGRVVGTPAALEALAAAGADVVELLARHAHGDWGDLGSEDKRLNDRAVQGRTRLLSAYMLSDSVKVWIITEADRSATTVLLPDEY